MYSLQVRSFIVLAALLLIAFVVIGLLLKGTSLEASFKRRRPFWLLGTAIVMLVPNFWLSMVLLAVVFGVLARRDPYPVSIFLMFFFVAPPIHKTIGGFGGLNYLLDVNFNRLLSLVVLVPALLSQGRQRLERIARPGAENSARLYRITDTLIIVYVLYVLALYLPHEPFTAILRRLAHLSLDILVPYFAISRLCRSREAVMDGLGALVIAGLILSHIAVFEHLKGWLLYAGLPDMWGEPTFFGGTSYLMRESALRSLASTGHALVLGHFLVVCIALAGLLFRELSAKRAVLLMAVLLIGMYCTVSRGPWISAVIVILMMGVFHRKATGFYVAVLSLSIVCVGIVAVSPWRDQVINFLPFFGKVDQFNIDYRKALLDLTFVLVKQRPFFGTVMVLDYMESLRQGQGIIDTVNVYAEVALYYGLVGLTLYVLLFLTAIQAALSRHWRSRHHTDERRFSYELSGLTVVALLGSMVTLAGIADYLSVPIVYSIVIAMLVAISRLPKQPAARQPTSKTLPRQTTASRPPVDPQQPRLENLR